MSSNISGKQIIRYGSILLLLIVIFGYGTWRSRDLLFGIRLYVSGISDGMMVSDSLLNFSGVAHHATKITVDGMIVPLAEDGTWRDSIALSEGYNVITISANDKFDRIISNQYRVFYKKLQK